MRNRSYFANTVESALSLARRELGDDTLLLTTGRTSASDRHLGAYEVVVGFDDPRPANSNAPPDRTRLSRLAHELAEVRGELTRLSVSLGGSLEARSVEAPRQQAGLWIERLETGGLPRDLAEEWVAQAEVRLPTRLGEGTCWIQALAAVARERVACETRTLIPGSGLVSFVGPAGAGKTSLLTKFAFRAAIEHKLPTVVISLDARKVYTSSNLASLAAILDVPFHRACAPEALEKLLHALDKESLVLIDTPGFERHDPNFTNTWREFWSHHPEITTHLVLNAQTRTADLLGAVQRWAPFRPAALAFTRLDETESLGGVLAVADRSRLPLSFFSAGQGIPESLVYADLESILNGIGRAGMIPQAAATP